MNVAIVTPTLTTADAVSNDVLGEAGALKRNGYKVKISSDLARVRKFLKNPADILIYHHSRGWYPGVQLVRERQRLTHEPTLNPYSQEFARRLPPPSKIKKVPVPQYSE